MPRKEVYKAAETFPRENAAAARGLRRLSPASAAPQLPERREARAPPARGPDASRTPSRPPGGPAGVTRPEETLARLGSPRPREGRYKELPAASGAAKEDARGAKPTAAALSPSRPAPRRKWAARRSRPPPVARAPPALPSTSLRRCSSRRLLLLPLPPFLAFPGPRCPGEPHCEEFGNTRPGPPKDLSLSSHPTIHSRPLVRRQTVSDAPPPPAAEREEER